ncbi:MAG TPA: hypothetical protein DCQ06_13320 [Myxococcales bacterium]|nr:hypothetical protein [Myxococcales bacterium]HAN32570.1 hypothetical protein [Myxococcales bacterium]
MTQDTPPPMPTAHNEDATQFIDASVPLDASVPPPFPPGQEPNKGHTNTQFAMSAMDDSVTSMGTAQQRRAEARARRPAQRPPTLLPNAEAAQSIRGPSTVRPGVLNPVQRQPEDRQRLGSRMRESSDVIAGLPQPMAPRAAQPARRPQRPASRPARAVAAPDSRKSRNNPRQTYNPQAKASAAGLLPLRYDTLANQASQHRRRLKGLYTSAKALEVCAGVVGTISLALMITSVVRLITGSESSVLTVVTAFSLSVMGYGLTSLMVIAAIALRQLAQLSAETSALIDGLSEKSPHR